MPTAARIMVQKDGIRVYPADYPDLNEELLDVVVQPGETRMFFHNGTEIAHHLVAANEISPGHGIRFTSLGITLFVAPDALSGNGLDVPMEAKWHADKALWLVRPIQDITAKRNLVLKPRPAQVESAKTAMAGDKIAHDAVNHPSHYNAHPSGVECITVVEHMPFNIGNAMKYLWRAGLKGSTIEDLKKARWYVAREIDRLEAAGKGDES